MGARQCDFFVQWRQRLWCRFRHNRPFTGRSVHGHGPVCFSFYRHQWIQLAQKKIWVFASGDIYIVLSIGLWLDKTTAVMVAGLSILLALLYGSVFRQPHFPFIPFLLFSFLMNGFI
ncbi:hypothetical protein [Candidatus Williamhamiltonella defendens]|uniref:hypothetical protein n=1 Tax=Candidatus Williamhamiltonella defendens TaxID=138072 RepID=UPI001F38965C|nr:hypothetical protein [Candidatus Hamiltonella defensa]